MQKCRSVLHKAVRFMVIKSPPKLPCCLCDWKVDPCTFWTILFQQTILGEFCVCYFLLFVFFVKSSTSSPDPLYTTGLEGPREWKAFPEHLDDIWIGWMWIRVVNLVFFYGPPMVASRCRKKWRDIICRISRKLWKLGTAILAVSWFFSAVMMPTAILVSLASCANAFGVFGLSILSQVILIQEVYSFYVYAMVLRCSLMVAIIPRKNGLRFGFWTPPSQNQGVAVGVEERMPIAETGDQAA